MAQDACHCFHVHKGIIFYMEQQKYRQIFRSEDGLTGKPKLDKFGLT